MYKCFTSDFEAVEKKIKAICKKLDKHGLHYTYEKFPSTIELIPHFVVDHSSMIQHKVGCFPHEVSNYNFEMERLKLGDWTPIVVIEHGANADNNENMVFPLSDSVEIDPSWFTIRGNCEHCGSNRRRIKTVILQDSQGARKQVGTTCIKDFTGIDAADIIGMYKSLYDIVEEELSFTESHPGEGRRYTDTLNYLSRSVELVNRGGYKKDMTKIEAFSMSCSSGSSGEAELSKAKEIMKFFKDTEFDEFDTFNRNIASALSHEYTKVSGFVAYAPIAYEKALELIRKKQEDEKAKSVSRWYGNVGDKVSLSLNCVSRHSFNSFYSGGTAYMYVFKDDSGNIFKWSTSKIIKAECGDIVKINGLIKKHSEYRGEKQTELTRCKIA